MTTNAEDAVGLGPMVRECTPVIEKFVNGIAAASVLVLWVATIIGLVILAQNGYEIWWPR